MAVLYLCNGSNQAATGTLLVSYSTLARLSSALTSGKSTPGWAITHSTAQLEAAQSGHNSTKQ